MNVDTASDDGTLQAIFNLDELEPNTGRVLLRPSGTEPLVRVMVEAGTHEQAQEIAERLVGVVKARLAL